MNKTNRNGKWTALLMALTAGALWAQPLGETPGAWQMELKAGAGYSFPGSLRGGAEVEGEYFSAKAEASHAQGRDWRATIGVGSLRWNADWSAPVDIGVAVERPFDRVEKIALDGSLSYRIDERLGAVGFGGIGWARARGSAALAPLARSKGDTYTLGAVVTYQARPDLTLSGGLLFATALEDSDLLIPVVAVRYRHDDHWTLRLFDASGIGNLDIFAVDYAPRGDASLRYSLSAQWANESYLLGRRPDGGRRVAVEDRAYRLLAGATWEVGDGFFLQPYLGYDLYRKLKFLSAKETLASHRVRDGWVAGLNAGWRF